MRPALAAMALLVVLEGCGRAPVFETYRDPSGAFTMDVPKGWQRDGDPDTTRRPVAVTAFIGQVAVQDEGTPLGAVLYVTRLSRRADHPKGEKAFRDYKRALLEPTAALFSGNRRGLTEEMRKGLPQQIEKLEMGGFPARTYRREFRHFNPLHMSEAVPMRLEDAVVETPEAYFVLEYRATADLFEKHYHAFQRARATFQPARTKPSG